jgi:hypothetical protein
VPIPCTGSGSKEVWNKSEDESDPLLALGITKDSDEYNTLVNCQQHEPAKISEFVIAIIKKKLRHSCFVAIEYNKDFLIPMIESLKL